MLVKSKIMLYFLSSAILGFFFLHFLNIFHNEDEDARVMEVPTTESEFLDPILESITHFQPTNQFDVIQYKYFDKNFIHHGNKETFKVKERLPSSFVKVTTFVISKVLSAVNKNGDKMETWVFDNFTYGYWRYDPYSGFHFILTFSMKQPWNALVKHLRVEVMQPVKNYKLKFISLDRRQKIFHLVCIICSVNHFQKEIQDFAHSLYHDFGMKQKNVLTFVMNEKLFSKNSLIILLHEVNLIKRKLTGWSVGVAKVKDESDAVECVEEAEKLWPSSLPMLLTQMNQEISQKVLERCLSNLVQPNVVYILSPFQQYYERIVSAYFREGRKAGSREINKHTGKWVSGDDKKSICGHPENIKTYFLPQRRREVQVIKFHDPNIFIRNENFYCFPSSRSKDSSSADRYSEYYASKTQLLKQRFLKLVKL